MILTGISVTIGREYPPGADRQIGKDGTVLFGYIKPYKPEMKIIEFDTYKAIYCGLCKQLGRAFGPFARMTLSYDFAFLSLLSLGVTDSCPSFKRESCAANPMKKKPCLCACDDSRFAASAAMTMLYYKVLDNYRDSGVGGRLASLLLLPWANRARKKARALYPQMDEIIGREMEKQRAVEAQGRCRRGAVGQGAGRNHCPDPCFGNGPSCSVPDRVSGRPLGLSDGCAG